MFLGAVMTWIGVYSAGIRPPGDFPRDGTFVVSRGEPLSRIAFRLHSEHLIRSPFWFSAFVWFLGGDGGAAAGEYLFKKPAGAFRIAYRITNSLYGVERVPVTIPEGTSIAEIAKILSRKLRHFDREDFLKRAAAYEGYLFPDTYFFRENATSTEIIAAMRENFDARLRDLGPRIALFWKPLREVIVMASLLEEEARTDESRRTIAGILWKRLKVGMPLQVDAVFPYILGKNTYQVTVADLQFDSPYNTYRFTGLPPGPITNPGRNAIEAAITPIETKYFYYLSDREGRMHYAVTHDEHVANKSRYLR